jgi:glycosyltransferase involved in cell wall biosynthesis
MSHSNPENIEAGPAIGATTARSCELTIVMPCLNEEETLQTCISKARGFLDGNGVDGEVVIADNGSTDGSREIALAAGARVVEVPEPGYGSALMGGIKAAYGRYVIMGDADDSYDFTSLMPFLEKLRDGNQLVMGNRFKGGIEPGAMPPLHRYLGNPVLSGVGKLFFRSSIGDFHCGLRGFDKKAIEGLDLQTTGMEFASEMVVKATLQDLRITEVPTTLSPDGRTRPPHLRSWRDGWRHLRFLLIYSPRWLFLYPGILFILIGTVVMLAEIIGGPIKVGRTGFDINTMLYAALFIVLGVQILYFALFSKVFGITNRLLPEDPRVSSVLSFFTLEKGLVIGGMLTLLGVIGLVSAIVIWGSESFGAMNTSHIMRLTIPSFTLTVIGIQTVFSSFFLAILDLPKRRPGEGEYDRD